MAYNGLVGAVLVEEIGEYEYVDGLFYVTYPSDTAPVRRCYRPHTFLKAIECARRAVEKMYAERENVVELRRAEH